jgi:hypothetical protein
MPAPEGLDERVIEVYRGVGQLLSRYTTGKVRGARGGGMRPKSARAQMMRAAKGTCLRVHSIACLN